MPKQAKQAERKGEQDAVADAVEGAKGGRTQIYVYRCTTHYIDLAAAAAAVAAAAAAAAAATTTTHHQPPPPATSAAPSSIQHTAGQQQMPSPATSLNPKPVRCQVTNKGLSVVVERGRGVWCIV
jgi:hypothetical protein